MEISTALWGNTKKPDAFLQDNVSPLEPWHGKKKDKNSINFSGRGKKKLCVFPKAVCKHAIPAKDR